MAVQQMPAVDFPQPDAQAAAVSQALQDVIKQEIQAAGGVIPFDRYMELALYEPCLGYYSNGTQKFGSAGDFVTAPEVSSLFGRCIAHSVAKVLASLTNGDLLELGAGSGVMAVDVLRELHTLNQLPAHYYILDRSAELRERQLQRFEKDIPEFLSRIVWLDQLPEIPINGVILGNEVADALAVKRFRWSAGKAIELGVGIENDALIMTTLLNADQLVCDRLSGIARSCGWSDGFESEFSPVLPAWIQSLSDCIDNGTLLLVDYGCGRAEYYHAQRNSGTLMCHYKHRAHPDPFLFPGLQDITAHVDFTALAYGADAAGLRLAGYCAQAQYLLDNGLEGMLAEFDQSDPAVFFKRVSELKTLTLPGEMGERFKAIAFVKKQAASPGGFAMQDLRSRL
jgi:SAM-dependent MidA family methyltransferase